MANRDSDRSMPTGSGDMTRGFGDEEKVRGISEDESDDDFEDVEDMEEDEGDEEEGSF